MTIEIVDFPIKNGGSFHSYVSLPEGIYSKLLEGNDLYRQHLWSREISIWQIQDPLI